MKKFEKELKHLVKLFGMREAEFGISPWNAESYNGFVYIWFKNEEETIDKVNKLNDVGLPYSFYKNGYDNTNVRMDIKLYDIKILERDNKLNYILNE